MFLAPAPEQTLGDLRQLVDQPVVTTVTRPAEIVVDLTRDNVIRFPRVSDSQTVEVPANATSLAHLANLLDVPSKFIERQDRQLQELLFGELIRRQTGENRLAYAPGQGLSAFHCVNDLVITPTSILSAVCEVCPDNAPAGVSTSSMCWAARPPTSSAYTTRAPVRARSACRARTSVSVAWLSASSSAVTTAVH